MGEVRLVTVFGRWQGWFGRYRDLFCEPSLEIRIRSFVLNPGLRVRVATMYGGAEPCDEAEGVVWWVGQTFESAVFVVVQSGDGKR